MYSSSACLLNNSNKEIADKLAKRAHQVRLEKSAASEGADWIGPAWDSIKSFVKAHPAPFIGAGLGAGLGGVTSLRQDPRRRNVPASLLTGALAGGATGTGYELFRKAPGLADQAVPGTGAGNVTPLDLQAKLQEVVQQGDVKPGPELNAIRRRELAGSFGKNTALGLVGLDAANSARHAYDPLMNFGPWRPAARDIESFLAGQAQNANLTPVGQFLQDARVAGQPNFRGRLDSLINTVKRQGPQRVRSMANNQAMTIARSDLEALAREAAKTKGWATNPGLRGLGARTGLAAIPYAAGSYMDSVANSMREQAALRQFIAENPELFTGLTGN